jgi:hypothetical protein
MSQWAVVVCGVLCDRHCISQVASLPLQCKSELFGVFVLSVLLGEGRAVAFASVRADVVRMHFVMRCVQPCVSVSDA